MHTTNRIYIYIYCCFGVAVAVLNPVLWTPSLQIMPQNHAENVLKRLSWENAGSLRVSIPWPIPHDHLAGFGCGGILQWSSKCGAWVSPLGSILLIGLFQTN